MPKDSFWQMEESQPTTTNCPQSLIEDTATKYSIIKKLLTLLNVKDLKELNAFHAGNDASATARCTNRFNNRT